MAKAASRIFAMRASSFVPLRAIFNVKRALLADKLSE
jgi:hypothetical protein